MWNSNVSETVTAWGGTMEDSKMRPVLKRTFRGFLGLALFPLLILALGPSSAVAEDEDRHDGERGDGVHNVLKRADAALYELSENACAVDATNQCVFDVRQAVARAATSSLQGLAKLGTALCPAPVLITNPKTNSCTVTATGRDFVAFSNGQGTVDGTFAVVVQLDNPVDSPELPVVLGEFSGTIDFTPAFSGIPLGFVKGSMKVTQSPLIPSLVGLTVPFKGVFRQPFALSKTGEQKHARRSQEAFYLLDNGSLDRVRQDERAVGWPTVRFEITFTQ